MLVPSVAVTPVGATVVVFVPSVVDKPPLVIAVVLPVPSVIVEEAPVTVCVLPDPSLNVADVKPIKSLDNLTFNVPAPSDITPILLSESLLVSVTPPLMDNTSPCLRTDVAPVSPSNLWAASAVALVMASSIWPLLTAESAAVPAAICLISVPPASMPEPPTFTVFVPSVAVIPVGATVVVFVPSVVDRPPFVRPVV